MIVSPFKPKTPDTTAERSGPLKSKAQQWREKGQMKARLGLTRTEYHLYGFDQQDKDYSYMLNFMAVHALRNKFRLALNDPKWKVVLDNKWLFHLHCSQFGLPLPMVYGIYDRGDGFTSTGRPLATAPDLTAFLEESCPPSLVAKPLGGIMGQQILILNELHYGGDTIEATTNTGQHLTLAELAQILDSPPNVKHYMSGGYHLNLTGYLLQAKVEQHPFLSELSPSTTNTVRVVTFLDHTNTVHIHFTILRLGRQGNVADNWDRGGISVAIDPETGVLGAGVLKPKYGGRWLEVHPDTGVRFTGRQLPYWEEIVALCRQTARVLPKVRSVGWDVAVTPTGPVLIEGNPDWDLPMVQVHTEGYLQPAIREQLAHLGLRFPEQTLPPVSLRDWSLRLRERYRDRAFHRSRK
ncbi:MAG TPA: sugar-transfer associated ATP-grasp domain-containing protein [Herpetosiphonaceae bacterium]|nr:sugar-transfer associated ATP-grasp domain-containing protein [Herpetosiphonaceae bacterium]